MCYSISVIDLTSQLCFSAINVLPPTEQGPVRYLVSQDQFGKQKYHNSISDHIGRGLVFQVKEKLHHRKAVVVKACRGISIIFTMKKPIIIKSRFSFIEIISLTLKNI